MNSEDIEYTILTKRECTGYRIPPVTSSKGHYAEEWKDQIFAGKLRLVARGPTCLVQLVTFDEQLFVTCPVDGLNIDAWVQRVVDSSRYFVLKVIGPQGQHAFIGMGFAERNDAFDFWAALVDFSERVKAERNIGNAAQDPDPNRKIGPDLSHLRMQEGQFITLGNTPKPSNGNFNIAPTTSSGTKGKLFKIAGPPK